MNRPIPLLSSCLIALAGASAWSQEVGRVLSTQPLVQQVAVPRQVCTTQQVEVQPAKSGAGAAVGAVAGAVIGASAGGRGPGGAAAASVGAVAGAVMGDRVESAPDTRVQTTQSCSVQHVYENRIVAYQVVYEFGGKQYSVQLPQDPGPTISLQITPVGAQTPLPAIAPVVSASPPVTTTVVIERPVPYPRVYLPGPWFWDIGPWGPRHHH
jgi:uncharacterized protein YcfJ